MEKCLKCCAELSLMAFLTDVGTYISSSFSDHYRAGPYHSLICVDDCHVL